MKQYEPIREIKFAAKSGFLTKELCDKYFTSGSDDWKNKLWARLLKKEYFRKHYSKLAPHVFVLNARSSLVKKLVGDEVVSPPFVSQLEHDEGIASSVLSLLRDSTITDFRLEPELKKRGSGLKRHYGAEQKDKYPDALVQLANEKKTRIAIELELTKKDPKRYRHIMEAYSSFQRADKVVFVVRDDKITQTIKQAMRDSYYPNWERPVGFVRLDDWNKSPSNAPIAFAEDTSSMFAMSKNVNEASS